MKLVLIYDFVKLGLNCLAPYPKPDPTVEQSMSTSKITLNGMDLLVNWVVSLIANKKLIFIV